MKNRVTDRHYLLQPFRCFTTAVNAENEEPAYLVMVRAEVVRLREMARAAESKLESAMKPFPLVGEFPRHRRGRGRNENIHEKRNNLRQELASVKARFDEAVARQRACWVQAELETSMAYLEHCQNLGNADMIAEATLRYEQSLPAAAAIAATLLSDTAVPVVKKIVWPLDRSLVRDMLNAASSEIQRILGNAGTDPWVGSKVLGAVVRFKPVQQKKQKKLARQAAGGTR